MQISNVYTLITYIVLAKTFNIPMFNGVQLIGSNQELQVTFDAIRFKL